MFTVQHNQAGGTKGNDGQESCLHSIAFGELVALLGDINNDEDNAPGFKLIDIAQLYKVRLEQLGLTLDKRIHSTRLKNRLLNDTSWSERTFTYEGHTSEF